MLIYILNQLYKYVLSICNGIYYIYNYKFVQLCIFCSVQSMGNP